MLRFVFRDDPRRRFEELVHIFDDPRFRQRFGPIYSDLIAEGFKKTQDPYGNSWKRLHPKTLRTRRRKKARQKGRRLRGRERAVLFTTKPLVRTGRLAAEAPRLTIRPPTRFEYGNKNPRYARFHQLGLPKKNIPQRAFYPIDRLPPRWAEAGGVFIIRFLGSTGRVRIVGGA